jgi:hypothetical protein
VAKPDISSKRRKRIRPKFQNAATLSLLTGKSIAASFQFGNLGDDVSGNGDWEDDTNKETTQKLHLDCWKSC